MKHGAVTRLDKKKTMTSKNDDDVSTNYDVIIIFPIYGLFGAIQNPESGCMDMILTFSLKATFHLIKFKTELKISSTALMP